MRPINIVDPAKGKKIFGGEINENTFIKRTVKSKHYFRNGKGYCIQTSILYQLHDEGIEYVLIYEDKKILYISKLSDWFDKGEEVKKGHGYQTCLRTDDMEESVHV